MRLIDADELKKKSYKHTMISQSQADYGFEYEWNCVDIEDLDDAPTIDAEPVRHGHWVAHPHQKHEEYIQGYGYEVCEWVDYSCSCCGKQSVGNSKHNYCPNCGAKMDEVS